MAETEKILIILTEGKSDNGRKATLAFSMGLASLTMGLESTIFLTSAGAIWGYDQSAFGISVPGFIPLDELINQYIESGGKLQLCSTCHLTCGAGDPRKGPSVAKLSCVEISGMVSVVERAIGGTTFTF